MQRVDFGDTACLSLKDLRKLSTEVAAYPAQALQVALANVSISLLLLLLLVEVFH